MTPQIAVLPGDVINKIAAGEVVERPASVVKELVENAIDAGATRVSVDVEQAGRRFIRVTDDGQGIASEEAALAFQRHATSKIRTEADLSTIQSMGFRGEALPSIAAVSKVRLVTVAAGSSMGTEVRLEGGALLAQRETAAAPGTTVEVMDLFYNTPARKKFLKSPATEFGHVCQAVQRQALAFPKIHFRLTHNGHVVADYPAVPTLRDRVQQVYGAQLVDTCVDLQEEAGRLRLEGLCTRPLETAHTKTPQDLFVNRRWVKNAAIVHALYEGYGTYLARGHQPRFVLSLWVDPRQVDVNVHPTKREVRFSDQEQVHEWVRSRIQASVKPASVASRTTVVSAWSPSQISDRPVATDGSRDVPGYANPAPDVLAGRQPRPAGVAELGQAYLPTVEQEEVRPLGQVANRYLVAQVGDELQIVDQHTAHERVLFERLLRQFDAGQITSQQALLPQVVELSAAEAVSVRAHLEDLVRLGFEVEEFGQGSFVVRAMPALFGQGDPQALLRALVEDWDAWPSTPSMQERYNTVLASVACHSAVRAGLARGGVAQHVPARAPYRHALDDRGARPHLRTIGMDIMMRDTLPVVFLVGPTAIGKSRVAISVAKALGTEILTADSTQVYRGMDIGTDKPTPAERERVPHRLIDLVEPDEPFNVGLYRRLALQEIARLHAEGRMPLVVGGTGLYVRALAYGLWEGPPADWGLRRQLLEEEATHGPGHLWRRLAQADPPLAATLHARDRNKIVRALEVAIQTGVPLSEWHDRHQFRERPFPSVMIGLTMDRSALYRRIDARVLREIDDGLVEETRGLLALGYDESLGSMKALGYRQMTGYLKGRYGWEEAVRRLQRDTRHFAKRQLTWFRGDPSVQWITIDEDESAEQIAHHVLALLDHLGIERPTGACGFRSKGVA